MPIYFDSSYLNLTLGYTTLNVVVPTGLHTVSFNSVYDCYNFNSIDPSQQMNIIANTPVQANFLPLAKPNPASPVYPANNATNIDPDQVLSQGIKFAITCGTSYFDIYYGTDQTAVANATPVSPEHVGTYTKTELPGLTFPVSKPSNNTTYYWRVDAKNILGTTKSTAWNFTTAP